ncbi:MAG: LptE family protein [Bacteroidales bacterium]|uniref:LptE family protein n=1 Tax=Porphyromonas sp. TaxID=1924944 RepID=UPI0029725ADF|nr:LptE family protein [Porphyromonas sp.]MDD7437679.1 LptE family protein [Bacteroidales bacterium]MDY3067626.1 LptE family protein [Porphyromonas sp.]
MRKYTLYTIWTIALALMMNGCSVSYSLNGASIDYTRIKTINITDFQNIAPIVYPPLAQKLSEDLKDRFQKQTRLTQTTRIGDINIEGEIVGYDLAAEAVQADAYAARTKLTMRVNVRYTNTVDDKESFEREFTSFVSFDSSQMFTNVQDQLVEDLTKDIINQIFNATVENW